MHSAYIASTADLKIKLNFGLFPANTICGEAFNTNTSWSGVIQSPNYPNNYPSNVNCTWTITAPPNEVITLTFTDLRLESHDACMFDYVQVSFRC